TTESERKVCFQILDAPVRSSRSESSKASTCGGFPQGEFQIWVATGSLSSVQANLGHRSQRVTERYAKAVAVLKTTDADKTAAIIRLPSENRHTGAPLEIGKPESFDLRNEQFSKSQTESQMRSVAILDS
ncbi:MAG: hypothetical protein AB7T49_16250, partial [Oligoflexales bacterium]